MPWNNIPHGFKLAHRLPHCMEKGVRAWRRWEWISSSSTEPAAQAVRGRPWILEAQAPKEAGCFTFTQGPLTPSLRWHYLLLSSQSPSGFSIWTKQILQSEHRDNLQSSRHNVPQTLFFNNSTECTQSQIQNDQKGLGSLNTKQGSRRLTALHLERLAAIGFEEPKHVISCGSRKINKESVSGQLVTYIIYCFYKVPSL